MNIYEKLGVKTLINAMDTYTIIGGSRMPDEVVQAMAEASRSFVNMEELHDKAGERIARLTKNEAAFVVNGAAAGLAIAAAACITGIDPAKSDRLPRLDGMKNEVIVHRSQRNGYDHAIRQVGVNLVEIGNVDMTMPWQLESAITDNTACIFYFASATLSKGALAVEEVIRIGKQYGVPVIVDAAAQLPPVENLWYFTQLGAEAAIFSGGKTLRGPQSSGLIVGNAKFIEACRMNSSPRHSLGRSMKVGREEIMGLLAAIERYVNLDHTEINSELEKAVVRIGERLNRPGIQVERLFPGPVGQLYPRAAVILGEEACVSAAELQKRLAEGNPGIVVGITQDSRGIIVNPMNLTQEEVEFVLDRIETILGR